MKKGGGKQKGSSFERDTCRKLSLWWTEDERDDIFWLTAGSGARATVRTKQSKTTANQHGDITFIDPIGKSLIDLCLLECKRGYSSKLDFLETIDKNINTALLFSFWLEAEKEREDSGRKYSCLIFRRDRGKACIIISKQFFNLLTDYCGEFERSMCELNLWYIEKHDIMVLRLDDFLQWVKREDIESFFERR